MEYNNCCPTCSERLEYDSDHKPLRCRKCFLLPGPEKVNHPSHYGGGDNPYEAIKVIEAWQLDFHLGNCVKYIARAGKKEDLLTDLLKAQWYLKRKIENLQREATNAKN